MKRYGKVTLWGIIILSFTIGSLLSLYTSVSSSGTLTFVDEEPVANAFTTEVVYISGAVATPGIYEINNTTRISEIVDRAGGFTETVNQEFVHSELNLADIVQDGDHINIPFDKIQSQTTTSTNNLGGISINNASLTELTSLTGVGPSTAQKIIDGRPYNSIEDLLTVSGIGEKTLDNIRNDITL